MKKFIFYLVYLGVFSFVLVFPNQSSSAQNPAMSSQASVTTYDELLVAIRQTRVESRQRVEQAVEREKVREAWETGKLIDTHVLQHKERADYGEQVLKRLSEDLGMSDTELYRMRQFARAYPISAPAQKLSWSHYRELLSLEDEKDRKEVTEKAEQENWGRDQVREEVRRRQAKRHNQEISVPKLTAKLGTPDTYQIIKAMDGPYKGQRVVDLGFAVYYNIPKEKIKFSAEGGSASGGHEGDVVRLVKGKLQKIQAGQDDLYTYTVYVREVLDGDTFHALVDLGFGVTISQTLRLRGIDAREIQSAEGMEAKQFLEKRLKKSPVLIRTVKSDKYDRYLADVFVKSKYINQELIDAGLATLVQD